MKQLLLLDRWHSKTVPEVRWFKGVAVKTQVCRSASVPERPKRLPVTNLDSGALGCQGFGKLVLIKPHNQMSRFVKYVPMGKKAMMTTGDEGESRGVTPI